MSKIQNLKRENKVSLLFILYDSKLGHGPYFCPLLLKEQSGILILTQCPLTIVWSSRVRSATKRYCVYVAESIVLWLSREIYLRLV